ncbi:DapH/DapD/GlmU-related protein [Lactiplantibacillus modestisalitolerans]|uniref:DapH/DapD/GlmU-related protein n=1 Tax=Lactiplantibacillus modestisalitolerans TaxID=1457219 RepID=A0ABV5WQW9_9LACO|nr:DapH/DapD/GlmU-related protein [Lactiplantibacillus modestisalitolerans]
MTKQLDLSSSAYEEIDQIVGRNQALVQKLNTGVRSADEVRQRVSEITNETVAASTEIRLPWTTDFGRNIHLGERVFINSGATFVDLGGIYIADDVLIGPNVTIASVSHQMAPAKRRNLALAPVYIQRNAWLAANVTVTPGVTIGENAVVAAGAVVTHDVPANTVVAGMPARVVKTISTTED